MSRTLNQTELSACFTRVYQHDIEPYLKTGIPELGINSLEPIQVPRTTFLLFFAGFIELKLQVEDLVITGLSNMSRSEVVVDPARRTVAGHWTFHRVECKSSKATMRGHVFRRNLPSQENCGGEISLSFDDLSLIVTAQFKPNKWELVSSTATDHGMKNLLATVQGIGLGGPGGGARMTDSFLNMLMRHYPTQLYQYYIRAKFLEIMADIWRESMEPRVWHEILKDF